VPAAIAGVSRKIFPEEPGMKRLPSSAARWLPLVATTLVCGVLYAAASIHFTGFFSKDVFIGFFYDQSFLGIAALGTTFVILSGGIDLSVGSVVGCSGIVVAVLIGQHHVPPAIAMAVVLAGGALLGMAMGLLIHFFGLAPFLVTLGGLFIVRGLALLVSSEQVTIDNPVYDSLSSMNIPLGGGIQVPLIAGVFIALAVILLIVLWQTPFGRNVYAIGGNETSAVLMGLKVGWTKIGVYTLGGFCSALAGVVFTIYTSSGNATTGVGMELDAIAAVVVGGTLLSGGVGGVAGTPLGVLAFGIIQQAINFQGTLSSWWTRIAIGALLLGFVVIQRLIQSSAGD
jgi:galactofuranose transport system permease protein